MKQWMLWTAVALIVVVALAGTFSHRVAVRDETERSDGDPMRLISLAPNVTEILFELRLGGEVVGVSTACSYPPEAEQIPTVGDLAAPDLELVQALRPDLVITTGFRDPEVKQALETAGVRVLTVNQSSLEDVVTAVGMIGRATGCERRAARYARTLRGRIERATVDLPESERPRVFVELSPQPLSTGAEGTFLDDLIRRAGGRNIAHDMSKPWTRISPDTVVARDPQIIIVAYPMKGDPQERLANRIGWGRVSAVRDGWVVGSIDRDLLLRPGPRLVDGLEALANLLRRYRAQEAK
ncbi:MAG: cobalamin-binding protein [Planctomycetota bacterium]